MEKKGLIVERTPTGWIAYGQGLAARGEDREAAERRYEAVRRLVQDLASRWRSAPVQG